MVASDLLTEVKSNLMLDHDEDDEYIGGLIADAICYAEGFQHREYGFYQNNEMSGNTRRGIVIYVTHLYESRDAATGGFFADNVGAGKASIESANNLLRMDREWKV